MHSWQLIPQHSHFFDFFLCNIFWIHVSGLCAFIHKNQFFLIPWLLTLEHMSKTFPTPTAQQPSEPFSPSFLTYTHNLLCPVPSFLSSQCFPTSFHSSTSVKEYVPIWFCSCSEVHFPYYTRDVTLDQSRINYIWWIDFGQCTLQILYIMVRFYNPAKKDFEASFGCTWMSNVLEVFMLSTVPMESKDFCLVLTTPGNFSRSPSDWGLGYTEFFTAISPFFFPDFLDNDMERRAYLTFLSIYIMLYHELRKPGFGGLHFFNIHLLVTCNEALWECSDTLWVHNLSSVAFHYTFCIDSI